MMEGRKDAEMLEEIGIDTVRDGHVVVQQQAQSCRG
jgi:hypothetical protein